MIAIATVGTYSYLKVKTYIVGPVISVEYPHNGQTLRKSFLQIEGRAQNVSFIYLNGRQIFVDSSGFFSERLLLYEGYNIITVEAKDRFGRVKTEKLELVYKPEI